MSVRMHQVRPLPSAKRATVLCIDDDPIVQLMLEDIIAGAGADFVIVGSAREAEDVLADTHFDLVLLDRSLPDGEGLSLLPSLRADNPGIHVIVFQDMFTDVKMIALYLFLGIADGLGDENVLDRFILLNVHPFHQPGNSITTENPE